MARQHRIQYPGAWYHVTHRGAGRQDIYMNDIDRRVFLKQLADTCERYGIEIHAYCLMTNHYHLLLRTPDANLSTSMRHLNSTYSQRFNRAHQTDGPVFRGRYAAQLIGEDDYILAVIRYVHLNPAGAGLESELGAYKWSSLPAFLQRSSPPEWLEMGWVRERFNNLDAFRKFTSAGVTSLSGMPDIDESKLVLGSSEFCESALRGITPTNETAASISSSVSTPDFGSIREAVIAVTGCGQSDVLTSSPGQRSTPRLVALGITSELTNLTRAELALVFGFKNHLGVATALQTVSQLNKRDQAFRALSAEVARMVTSGSEPLDYLSTDTGT